ncbi:MAG TPA: cupredoxin domain-containing protein, partial [Acidimicrobiia bacterium]
MSRSTAPRLVVALLAVAALVPLALPAEADTTPRKERTVRVFDFAFDPVPVDVEAGDTVIWVLDQSAQNAHSVTSDDDGGFSQDLAPGSPSTVFRHTFDVAGKYAYYCRFHLFSNSMVGQVQVTDPPPT